MNPNGRRWLMIDRDAAGAVRQLVGPVAWFAAEEMVLAADGGDEYPVVSISVRSLALRLGLGRDTVGSALARLREAGLVTVEATRAAGGRFAGIRYRVQVPGLVVEGNGIGPREPGQPSPEMPDAAGPSPGSPPAVVPGPVNADSAQIQGTRRSSTSRRQLSLLDTDPSTATPHPDERTS